MKNTYSKEVLMVFVKNPELGKAKTRLAKTVGDRKALDVYLQLLRYTKSTLDQIPQEKQVHYSNFLDSEDFWENDEYKKSTQCDDLDLGNRMKHAFEKNFEHGYEKVMIVGSDCPEITKEVIMNGFETLEKNDVVFGPAEDGGYYLLGMRKMVPELFNEKEWSSDSVLSDSIENCKKLDLSYALLETLTDIDVEDDWKKFEKKLKKFSSS